MRTLALLLLFAAVVAAAEDPYAPWMQGRPREAIAALRARADQARDWAAWYDCALAASASGERGPAAAWLLEAHRLAPERREPLRALRADGAALPATWCERVGPLAWPGTGWRGPLALGGAGLALGWWLGRRGRGWAAPVGALLLALGAPGAVAAWHDGHEPLLAVVRGTSLLDSTGAAIGELPAGVIGRREAREPWNGRALISLSDGRRGYVSLSDAGLEAAEHY